jgi:hypothetical protein
MGGNPHNDFNMQDFSDAMSVDVLLSEADLQLDPPATLQR